jgi:hypothetical protein
MSTKIKKALEHKKQEAVDVNATIPEDQKVNIGGLNLHGTLNLNGNKKPKQSKKKPINIQTTEPMRKVSISLDDVKKQFSVICKITVDSYGYTASKDPETDTVLTYLVDTKKQGISHYVKNGSTWKVSERFTSQKEIDDLFEQLTKEISARASWKSSLTPKYLHSDGFVTTSKTEMEEHLKSLL